MRGAGSGEKSLLEAFDQRRRAARRLHDEIGPLLSAAGLRLQLLKMDHPAAATVVEEAQRILDQAMDNVRVLSQELEPSVVERAGLARALESLAGRSRAAFQYRAESRVPVDAAIALYAVAEWALEGSSGGRLAVTGRRILRLTVRRPGSPGRLPPLTRALARRAGIELDIRTNRSTIVTTKYAV